MQSKQFLIERLSKFAASVHHDISVFVLSFVLQFSTSQILSCHLKSIPEFVWYFLCPAVLYILYIIISPGQYLSSCRPSFVLQFSTAFILSCHQVDIRVRVVPPFPGFQYRDTPEALYNSTDPTFLADGSTAGFVEVHVSINQLINQSIKFSKEQLMFPSKY